MAIVDNLKKAGNYSQGPQKNSACAYKVMKDENGKTVLQIETFRANDLKMEGDPTQIIKFTPKALKQLAKILLVDILLKEG